MAPNKKQLPKKVVAKNVLEKFFVLNPKCKMPRVNPFVKGFPKFRPLRFKSCTDEPSLVSVIYDREKKHYMLHLNMDVSLNHFADVSDFGCTYIEVVPGASDVFA